MKKIILSLFITTLATAPAFGEMNCKSWGPKIINWGPKSIFSSEQVMEVYDMMEKKNGLGRFFSLPKSYEEIFFQDKDFNVEEIDLRSEEAKNFWSTDLSSYRDAANLASFDLSIFRQLNLSAYNIWQKLIVCNGGDKGAARKNYFMGNPCPNSKEENQELVRELSDLNTGLAEFLLTSDIFNFQGEVAFSIQLPAYHPLLTQILLQQFAAGLNLADERKQAWVPALDDIMEILLPQKRDFPYHPWYKPDSQTVNLVKSILNTAMLVASIPASDSYMLIMRDRVSVTPTVPSTESTCSVYGLWPGMNRAVLFPLEDYSATHTALQQPLAKIGHIMAAKGITNCGTEISIYQEQTRGTYSRFAPIHIHELRRLAATYYPEKLGGRGYDTLLSSQGYTKYQKALCNWW